jgi:hypothetical protein
MHGEQLKNMFFYAKKIISCFMHRIRKSLSKRKLKWIELIID